MKRTRLHATLLTTNASETRRRPFLWATLLAMISVLGIAGDVLAGDPLRYRPGLRNAPSEKRLDEKQLELLTRSLRAKTGFAELRFDDDGFLTLGDRSNIAGGSASARELLIATTEIKHAIDLESHPCSMSVSFARIADQICFESRATGAKIDRTAIQLDFNDFSQIRGDREAVAAFDIGFVLIHELGHTVLGLHDSYDNSPGDCETMVNRIRRELSFPERQTYLAQVYSPVQFPSSVRVKRAELVFKHVASLQGMRPSYRLDWDAQRVGPILGTDVLSANKVRALKPTPVSAAGQ